MLSGNSIWAQWGSKVPKYLNTDGFQWERIQGGTFIAGRDERDPFDYSCPGERQTTVHTHFMSQTEVSIGQYKMFLEDIRKNFGEDSARALAPDFSLPPDSFFWWMEDLKMLWDSAGYEDYPVQYITWFQADDYCKWLAERILKKIEAAGDTAGLVHFKLRLPTEDELEYALTGFSPGLYPWGRYPYELKGRKNRLSWPANYGKILSEKGTTFKRMDDDGYETTAPVRQFKHPVLELYNLSGNVAEFTETVADSARFEEILSDGFRLEPFNYSATFIRDSDDTKMVVKGGSWLSEPDELIPASSREVDRNRAYPDVGFRPVILLHWKPKHEDWWMK